MKNYFNMVNRIQWIYTEEDKLQIEMATYKLPKYPKGSLTGIPTTEGETIETKVFRMINNKESIGKEALPLIYTDRKDGVQPAYDIRTDKWEIAVEAQGKVAGSYEARRKSPGKLGDGEAKSIHDTKDQSAKTQGVTE